MAASPTSLATNPDIVQITLCIDLASNKLDRLIESTRSPYVVSTSITTIYVDPKYYQNYNSFIDRSIDLTVGSDLSPAMLFRDFGRCGYKLTSHGTDFIHQSSRVLNHYIFTLNNEVAHPTTLTTTVSTTATKQQQ
jgi:hypothetical protein